MTATETLDRTQNHGCIVQEACQGKVSPQNLHSSLKSLPASRKSADVAFYTWYHNAALQIQPADHVLVLTVPEDVAIQRLLQRGAESGRADDNEETIRNRLQIISNHHLRLVIHYFRHRSATGDSGGSICSPLVKCKQNYEHAPFFARLGSTTASSNCPQVFQEESVPVIEHLKASGRVQEVEASADEDTVFAAVAPLMDMLQERGRCAVGIGMACVLEAIVFSGVLLVIDMLYGRGSYATFSGLCLHGVFQDLDRVNGLAHGLVR
eukprot:1159502-Pelagomonas_calceolata.AAC.18